MLQKITKIPCRFYQLVLLNIGLVIALSKQMSLLAILSSLLFVALAVAPVAVALGFLAPPPHQLIHQEIINKLKKCHDKCGEYLNEWKQLSEQKKVKTVIKVSSILQQILVALYVSLNFMCPCLQAFLFVNLVFIYINMQEEVQCLKGMLCKLCKGECPVGLCKE